MRIPAAARIAVSLAVFGAVLWFVDVGQLAKTLAGASLGWLAAAFLANIGGIYLTSRVLCALCADRVRPLAVFRINLISIYLSTFMPGDVAAGLVSRVRYLGLPTWQEIVHRTLLERIIGLTMFSAIAAASFPLSSFAKSVPAFAIALPVGVFLAGSAFLPLAANPGLMRGRAGRLDAWLNRTAPSGGLPPLALRPRHLGGAASAYLCFTLVSYALLQSLGAAATYADAVVLAYLLTLAQLVPFFFAGIGIRDASAVAILAAINVSAETAVAMSALVLAIIMTLALVGGALQVREERKLPRRD